MSNYFINTFDNIYQHVCIVTKNFSACIFQVDLGLWLICLEFDPQISVNYKLEFWVFDVIYILWVERKKKSTKILFDSLKMIFKFIFFVFLNVCVDTIFRPTKLIGKRNSWPQQTTGLGRNISRSRPKVHSAILSGLDHCIWTRPRHSLQ